MSYEIPIFDESLPIENYLSNPDGQKWIFQTNEVRTINEICIDADNNKGNFFRLGGLLAEVHMNCKKYSLSELEFMLEHINRYLKPQVKELL